MEKDGKRCFEMLEEEKRNGRLGKMESNWS